MKYFFYFLIYLLSFNVAFSKESTSNSTSNSASNSKSKSTSNKDKGISSSVKKNKTEDAKSTTHSDIKTRVTSYINSIETIKANVKEEFLDFNTKEKITDKSLGSGYLLVKKPSYCFLNIKSEKNEYSISMLENKVTFLDLKSRQISHSEIDDNFPLFRFFNKKFNSEDFLIKEIDNQISICENSNQNESQFCLYLKKEDNNFLLYKISNIQVDENGKKYFHNLILYKVLLNVVLEKESFIIKDPRLFSKDDDK